MFHSGVKHDLIRLNPLGVCMSLDAIEMRSHVAPHVLDHTRPSLHYKTQPVACLQAKEIHELKISIEISVIWLTVKRSVLRYSLSITD